jgi:uncharacterized protein YecE (DUF72 family)
MGTSGFSYPAWKGRFYPAELRPTEMLRYYAERLSTVEINNTFYRMPQEKLLVGWAEQVPEGFQFALKAPQRITHQKRLAEAADPTVHFFRVASALGARLGPALFQLPPNMKKDLPRLEAFLAALPAGARPAFEFRHPSWFEDDVLGALAARGASLCVAESEELATPVAATTSWGYLRLRREDYDDAAIAAWAARILAQPWQEAFVYFKHEDAGRGPALAEKLSRLVAPPA